MRNQDVDGRRLPALSVFFFSCVDTGTGEDRYQFVMDTAVLADELGFEAVWIPERHFHQFGGLFPNPAVVAAGIAAKTRKIAIRAGSVVAPLHHPVRIAEDWGVVDAMSGGRAGISLASGWNRADFAIAQCGYDERQDYLLSALDAIRALWRGDELALSAQGKMRTYPSPVRHSAPIWLTAMSGPATFRQAAKRGLNLLTAYLQLDRDQMAANIAEYRATFQPAKPGDRPHVTLMMHACVADTTEAALRAVEQPLLTYQNQFLDLHHRGHDRTVDGEALTPDEQQALARYAARKYATDRGLVGGKEDVTRRLRDLAALGVDEVACLIDFGLAPELVSDTLRRLAVISRDQRA